MTREEFIEFVYTMHLQNTNGRESPDEMFKLGVAAAYDEMMNGCGGEENKCGSSRQLAINECFFNGIGISSIEFDKAVREYNNHEMPLSERQKRIAEKKEPKFIEFIKHRYGL